MLRVIFVEGHKYTLSVECHYAECHNAGCHYAESRCAERNCAGCYYAECHYAGWHYAEWHYANCRHAECRGTIACNKDHPATRWRLLFRYEDLKISLPKVFFVGTGAANSAKTSSSLVVCAIEQSCKNLIL
jgi:hypothetical protein